jgi:hypothetical protein
MFDRKEKRKFLRGRQAFLRAERKKFRAALLAVRNEEREVRAQLALLDEMENGVDSPKADIQAPPNERVGSQDSIISLLTYNPAGLTQEQIIDYLGPKIQTKQKSREKAIRDALSHLKKNGRIQKSGGVYRATELAPRRVAPV